MVSIHSEEENQFIRTLALSSYKIKGPLNLGLQFMSNNFKWSDGSEYDYNNLSPGLAPGIGDVYVLRVNDGRWYKSLMVPNYQICQTLSNKTIIKNLDSDVKKLQNSTQLLGLDLIRNYHQTKLVNETILNIQNKLKKRLNTVENKINKIEKMDSMTLFGLTDKLMIFRNELESINQTINEKVKIINNRISKTQSNKLNLNSSNEMSNEINDIRSTMQNLNLELKSERWQINEIKEIILKYRIYLIIMAIFIVILIIFLPNSIFSISKNKNFNKFGYLFN